MRLNTLKIYRDVQALYNDESLEDTVNDSYTLNVRCYNCGTDTTATFPYGEPRNRTDTRHCDYCGVQSEYAILGPAEKPRVTAATA